MSLGILKRIAADNIRLSYGTYSEIGSAQQKYLSWNRIFENFIMHFV